MAYLEERLRRIGVMGALEAEGFRAGRRAGGRRGDVRARPGSAEIERSRISSRVMRRVVIKLGSSIVAEDSGELRAEVLARICDAVAGLHESGDEVVMVSSGAIARGMRVLALDDAPGGDRRAAGRERRRAGEAVPGVRRAAARARADERAGAADDRRSERADALPERQADLAQAVGLAGGGGGERERHDRDGRDLLRRQRLPGGAGGDARGRRSAGAADRHRRSLQRRSAAGGERGAGRGGRRTSRRLEELEIGHTHLAAGLGGDALEGRGGRHGHGGGDRRR